MSDLSKIIKERSFSREMAEYLTDPSICKEISVHYEAIRRFLPVIMLDIVNVDNHAQSGTLLLGARSLTERLDMFSSQAKLR